MLQTFVRALAILAVTGQASIATADCIVLYFQSAQCQPCRQLDGTLGQVAQAGWDIRRIEAPAQLELARRFQIQNLPTLVVLSDDREVDRIVGVVSAEQLTDRLRRAAARQQSAAAAPPPNVSAGPASHGATTSAHSGQPPTGPIIRGQSPAALPSGFPMLASAAHAGATAVPRDVSREHSLPPASSTSPEQPARQQAVDRATQATVRIKVQEANTTAYGTGTIVAVHQDEALVLTCGHLFRDMLPGSQLTVDLFAGSPRQTSVVAQLIDFKADKEDVGLLSIRLPVPIEPVTVLPKSEGLQVGQPVFSLGCDHGHDPSLRDSRITHINRYLGPANVEITGAPAVGRSGGGLFDQQGRLVGVCNAACNQDNEGIYAAAEVIYQQLSRVDQAHLFNPPAAAPTAPMVRTISGEAKPAGTPPQPAMTDSLASDIQWPDETASGPAANGQPQSSQVHSSQPSDSIELICVLRTSGNDERVVTIRQPSQSLLQAIQQHSASSR